MNSWTKNNLSCTFQIIALILVTVFALTGPAISFTHQYYLIVEEFGKFIYGVFIYDVYVWWNLTVLILLPYGIYFRAWIKKTNIEVTKEMHELMSDIRKDKNV